MRKKRLSIAVLPFVNMSSDENNEYFSDGVTEEIINVLSKNQSLKVTSRTSSFFFKGKNLNIQDIGNQLNVSMILEGSVRKAENHVRITAQLINSEDGFHFWSETYNHELVDIFQTQDEISISVAEKMREHLGHFEIEIPVVRKNNDLNAYELYLKSKYNFNKFRKDDINLAVRQIEEVIQRDATCSYYFATKAIYFGYLGLLNILAADKAFHISKEAAEKALLLDDTDPEANYAIALVAYFFEGDLDKAQVHCYLALKYRPNYPDALMGVSMVEIAAQNYDIALDGIQRAVEIDPLSPTLKYYHAAALQRVGEFTKALGVINEMLGLVPHHTNSYCLKGVILTRLGKFDQAIEHYKYVPISLSETRVYYSGIGIVYATMGNKSKAEEYLGKVNLDSKNFNVAYEENANVIINIYLGNIDQAFETLGKDIEAKKYYLKFFRVTPAFDLIKDDSRYEMLEKIFVTPGNRRSGKKEKYLKSGLSKEKLDAIDKKLLHLMSTEKPFLNSDFNMKSLSDSLNESANHVSQVVNDIHEKNFFDFVNSYRIEEMTKLVKVPSNNNFTLLALAYEAGFNSKSTFNAAFKKLKDQTPSKYFKELNLMG